MIRLESCDVLLDVDEGKGWKSIISRWGIGLYNHVFMYLGKGFGGIPFVYESEGRGVSIQNLQHHTGELVVVMRPKEEITKNVVGFVLEAEIVGKAINIASDGKSYYDYLSIVTSCLPRVLKEKYPWLPIPLKYQRDPSMICSEAVAECFWRARIEVVSKDVIPLPIDFATSRVLSYIGSGRVLEDIQPG